MTDGLRRNLAIYPWYAGLFHAYFWLPIYFLFFSSELPLTDVLELESIYFIAVVVMEVPSGWASDVFGRKRTLVIASCLLAAAYVTFLWATSFGAFAAAQVLLAAGIAFNSGTDTSLLLETTQALGREKEYLVCEARATKFNFLGSAVAGVLGGLAAIPDFRGAYVLSLVGACVMIGMTLRFVEPPREKSSLRQGMISQMLGCLSLLRGTRLLWLFVFAVFMTVLNHIPYEFYQPYVETLAAKFGALRSTPVLTSVHLAITMLIAAWFASMSVSLRRRIGTGGVLLSACGLQVAIMTIMHFFLSIPAALFMLLRSCPRALMTAPLNAAVAPALPSERRATYLSIQSFAGRLAFAGTLAWFATMAGGDDWSSIANMLGWGMWIGLGGLAFLTLTARAVFPAR